ncbi:peptidoglycan recognition protein family protein [Patescibacteria group bacterium]|nr:peptidoglycan recognition protein family protein [Patescibacteria group bacterium]
MNTIGQVKYLIIHHTERNNDFPFFVRLRHKYLRGWDDTGYHYLIGNTRPFTKNGKLYTGRSEEFEGAHTLGYNGNSLGICLIGNFDKVIPSEKQFETLFSLLEEKIKKYNVTVENVRGHSEFPNVEKSCPGKLLNMNYVRAVLSGQENNY